MSETPQTVDVSQLSSKIFLSAQELFKWRKRENLSVPQRGGAKDFEPDGSWLQAKRLDAFYEEQRSVLAEPRVEKSGNLVKGTWNADLKLVNIEKTAKFWMKMGFADQHRNWLHPEEALFLMEVNCLDVSYDGLRLSLQEAYSLFLAPVTDVTVEEYQVYGHLRRLGYIVIRHAGKLDLTSYERKIGLDRHVKKKKQQHRKGKSNSTSDREGDDSVRTKLHTSDTPGKNENVQAEGDRTDCSAVQRMEDVRTSSEFISTPVASQGENSDRLGVGSDSLSATSTLKRKAPADDKTRNLQSPAGDATEPFVKKTKRSENSVEITQSVEHLVSVSDPWTLATAESLSRQSDCTADCKSKRTFTSWDFDAINFPDIAGKDTVTVEVSCQDLLPPNTCLNEDFEDVCMFDVEDYKRQQQQQSSARQGKFDRDSGFGHLKDLQFSYAEWVQQHSKPVIAKNWGEWKTAMQERNQSSFFQSPVAHLWKGEVTPLVRPKDSVSTAALLEKLSIIKPFKGPCPANSAGNDVKIVFDVYLPNTTFRKTSPGIPDHRICVARGEEPPDFFQAQSATAHLEDDVPLHWAVVNCGEISFFIFENSSLPVHTSSLG